MENDPVNHPSHYTQSSSIECIDAIEAAIGREGMEAFLTGQCIKYLWRQKRKFNQLEDLKKARWYLDRLIRSLEE